MWSSSGSWVIRRVFVRKKQGKSRRESLGAGVSTRSWSISGVRRESGSPPCATQARRWTRPTRSCSAQTERTRSRDASNCSTPSNATRDAWRGWSLRWTPRRTAESPCSASPTAFRRDISECCTRRSRRTRSPTAGTDRACGTAACTSLHLRRHPGSDPRIGRVLGLDSHLHSQLGCDDFGLDSAGNLAAPLPLFGAVERAENPPDSADRRWPQNWSDRRCSPRCSQAWGFSLSILRKGSRTERRTLNWWKKRRRDCGKNSRKFGPARDWSRGMAGFDCEWSGGQRSPWWAEVGTGMCASLEKIPMDYGDFWKFIKAFVQYKMASLDTNTANPHMCCSSNCRQNLFL